MQAPWRLEVLAFFDRKLNQEILRERGVRKKAEEKNKS
jgi:hypothetical protein